MTQEEQKEYKEQEKLEGQEKQGEQNRQKETQFETAKMGHTNHADQINQTVQTVQAGQNGLVLEGGGMRGIYTAGVLDVFMDRGLSFDGVIGVSAGAIHGCSFVSGQKGRSIRYYKKYGCDSRFLGWKTLLRTGDIVDEEFCYHEIPEKLDPYDFEAFKNSKTAFYVTCSNVETGEPEYLRITDMKEQIDLMRASASLPYVSRLVEADGMKLLDGGCTDSIPVEKFREMGYTKTVVVLTRNRGYVKKPENEKLTSIYYRHYPNFGEALKTRHMRYNETVQKIEELEREGKIFVIRPSQELTIGRTERNPIKLQETYETGRRDALCRMKDLIEWWNKAEK